MPPSEELRLLKSVLEQLPGNVYWKNKEGKFLGCNNNTAKIFNARPDDLINLTDYELMPIDMARKLELNNQLVMSTGKELISEEDGIDKNHMPARYLSYKSPLKDELGCIIGIIGTSLNIENIKMKEQQLLEQKDILQESLQKVINIMPGNVYWKSINGHYLGCNQNQANMLGLASPDDIRGKSTTELFHEFANAIIEVDQQVMSDNKFMIVEEKTLNKTGEIATYLSHKLPLLDKNNNVNGLLGVSIDISKQKQIERDLTAAKEKAEEANQTKSELLLNLSHDLRTPCANIIGLTESILKNNTATDINKDIKHILDCSESVLTMLDEILGAAQLDNTDQYAASDYFNINAVINSSINILKPNILKKGLNYIVDTSQVIQPELIGDKEKLRRIIINLLSNATKFTEQGTITLKAKQTQLSDEECHIEINIVDTGIGIPPDKLDRIFEKFHRLHPSFQGIYKGTGIGLYTVKRLTKILNGTINVTSQLNTGSTFQLGLKFQQAKNASNQCNNTLHKKYPSIRVLIIEDNSISRVVTKNIFDEFHCKVDTVSNGRDAMSSQLSQYHLIIMDIGLPDIDGHTLAKKIKLKLKGVFPIIHGLTAHATLKPTKNTALNQLFNKPLTYAIASHILKNIAEKK